MLTFLCVCPSGISCWETTCLRSSPAPEPSTFRYNPVFLLYQPIRRFVLHKAILNTQARLRDRHRLDRFEEVILSYSQVRPSWCFELFFCKCSAADVWQQLVFVKQAQPSVTITTKTSCPPPTPPSPPLLGEQLTEMVGVGVGSNGKCWEREREKLQRHFYFYLHGKKKEAWQTFSKLKQTTQTKRDLKQNHTLYAVYI